MDIHVCMSMYVTDVGGVTIKPYIYHPSHIYYISYIFNIQVEEPSYRFE